VLWDIWIAMSISRQEEIISVLLVIAALLAFADDHTSWGGVFAIKATTDMACAIYYSIREWIDEKRTKTGD
jgi:hypothetical protein